MSSQPGPIEVDPVGIRECFNECPEILGPVAKLFREDYVSDLHELRHALENGDGVRFAFLAHKIKGSASYFRVEQVTNLAAELEARGECGNLTGAAALVDRLGEGLDSVSVALGDEEERLAGCRPADRP
jgi:HPt (histidine-containing phosphotransfer) domain-containing protein